MGEFDGGFLVFDDMIDYNPNAIDPKFTKGKHKGLDVQYLSQTCCDLSKKQSEKKGTKKICSNNFQALLKLPIQFWQSLIRVLIN